MSSVPEQVAIRIQQGFATNQRSDITVSRGSDPSFGNSDKHLGPTRFFASAYWRVLWFREYVGLRGFHIPLV